MKFDPTGLVPLNFSDCWLICYFALAAAVPAANSRPPAHPIERTAPGTQKMPGPGGEPSAIVEVTPAGLSVNGRQTDADGLAAALRRLKPAETVLTVEVRVADGVPYQDVDAVLAAARDVPGIKLRLRRLS